MSNGRDWLDDDNLSPSERRERFQNLPPVEVTAPPTVDSLAILNRAVERLEYIRDGEASRVVNFTASYSPVALFYATIPATLAQLAIAVDAYTPEREGEKVAVACEHCFEAENLARAVLGMPSIEQEQEVEDATEGAEQ